jgi:hypothetical protein
LFEQDATNRVMGIDSCSLVLLDIDVTFIRCVTFMVMSSFINVSFLFIPSCHIDIFEMKLCSSIQTKFWERDHDSSVHLQYMYSYPPLTYSLEPVSPWMPAYPILWFLHLSLSFSFLPFPVLFHWLTKNPGSIILAKRPVTQSGLRGMPDSLFLCPSI